MNETEKNPPLLHRDDVPMEVAETLVERLKELYGDDIKVQFAGDSTKELPPDVIEANAKLHKHFIKCFVEGLCHVCEAKFPGKWPPDEDDDWNLQGWAYYDTDSEDQVPLFACPSCEEADRNGQPKPMEIPDA